MLGNECKISIVLPTYNGSRWLADSIESVLRQTEENWELTIVNDCSTDETLDIAERYVQQDRRIKVCTNPVNKKLPASLNIGFSHSMGMYRTWTSDDNMFKPKALSIMAEYLDDHPDIDMVAARQDIINENGTLKESMLRECLRQPEQLSYTNNIGAAFMYRTAIAQKIGGYDEERFCVEDYDYWCRIALAGSIAYINDNVYLYRESPQSLTATQKERVMEKCALLKNEYKGHFVERFKLTWWQQAKLEYLIDKARSRRALFALFGARRILLNLLIGVLFCWNRNLRRRLRTITDIKI